MWRKETLLSVSPPLRVGENYGNAKAKTVPIVQVDYTVTR